MSWAGGSGHTKKLWLDVRFTLDCGGCEEGGKEKTHVKGSRKLLHTQAWILGKSTGWGRR